MSAYGNLLLRQDHSAVLAAHTYRHNIGSGDGLEGIFCSDTSGSAMMLCSEQQLMKQI